jgi:carbonic anhydrase/acetyltransferase-like protein (isoleucine patch superfamily)
LPDLIAAGGSHGSDIQAIFTRAYPVKVLRLWDDNPQTGLRSPNRDELRHVIIGVNDPKLRRDLAEQYETDLGPPKALVDPAAIVGAGVTLGRGSVVAPLVCLLHDVSIGEHVHLNYGASMTRCQVGAYTTVSPGAVICGDVVIGGECLIGAGAVICDRVTLGTCVTVAAGAIIPPTSVVPSGATVIGVWKG